MNSENFDENHFEEENKKNQRRKFLSENPEIVKIINDQAASGLFDFSSNRYAALAAIRESEAIKALGPQMAAALAATQESQAIKALAPQIVAALAATQESQAIKALAPQIAAGMPFIKNIIPISGMYELFNESVGLSISSLMHNTFSDSVRDLLKDYRETLEVFKGYSIETFLPVHRVDIDDHLSEGEIEKAILKKELDIINSAKKVSPFLHQENDPFADAFDEIITAIENKTYFSAQALSANIFGMIREFRLRNYANLHDGKPFRQMSTIEDYKKFLDFATIKYKKPKEMFLVVIILQLFIHTKYINEDTSHLPSRTTNRSASVHSHIGYYSKYNSLCFLLYLSEVFELVHALKNYKDSVIVSEEEWKA